MKYIWTDGNNGKLYIFSSLEALTDAHFGINGWYYIVPKNFTLQLTPEQLSGYKFLYEALDELKLERYKLEDE